MFVLLHLWLKFKLHFLEFVIDILTSPPWSVQRDVESLNIATSFGQKRDIMDVIFVHNSVTRNSLLTWHSRNSTAYAKAIFLNNVVRTTDLTLTDSNCFLL